MKPTVCARIGNSSSFRMGLCGDEGWTINGQCDGSQSRARGGERIVKRQGDISHDYFSESNRKRLGRFRRDQRGRGRIRLHHSCHPTHADEIFEHQFLHGEVFSTEREAVLSGLREGMLWLELKIAKTIRL
ncbi:hypothetical protein [Paraburkholderia sp. BL10I2N1]|uniref:hypothetical protein n=1 Tax=Paraburkholderia sp. BL10I2N1 TaxID=1938796 RepID=UPI001FB7237F|nr:hypothetical protein [Paraburkholderia sp. BL10I2N1]